MTTMSVARLTSFALSSGRLCARRCFRYPGPLDQARDRIRQLGALVLPVIDAFQRKAQRFFAFGGNRVVETDALDKSTVATVARIGDDDIEERPLLGAASGQSDHYHEKYLLSPEKDIDYMMKTRPLATGARTRRSIVS